MSVKGTRFKARISHDGKQHHLGSFSTKEEAAAAYDKATRQYKGSTAVCNYASEKEGEAAVAAATVGIVPRTKGVSLSE